MLRHLSLEPTVSFFLLGNPQRFWDKKSTFFKECQKKEHDASMPCWSVYCIYDTVAKAVKVGVSQRPLDRLEQLQTGNPNYLYLGIVVPITNGKGKSVSSRRAKQEERSLHEKLTHLRMDGGTEWFKDCSEQRRIVEQHFGLRGDIVWNRVS